MIIYIHGYNSTGLETFGKIKEGIPDSIPMKLIQYDTIDADVSYKQIMEQLTPHLDDDILIVGSSLGGFWANYFACKYAYRMVLINPATQPHISLKKYQENTDSFLSYEKIINERLEHCSNVCYRTLILGLQDEVLDPRETLEYYERFHPKIYTFAQEKHRFKDFNPINKIIRKIYNTYY